jgi:5-methylcytosine-specific restriction protein A
MRSKEQRPEWKDRFYNSDAWKHCRAAYVAMQCGQCERCKQEFEQGRRTLDEIHPGVIVHHKIYLNAQNVKDPKVSLNFDNLELLCSFHHNREHHGEPPRYRFDRSGNIIYAREK